ncbi:hypothetical protein ACJ41O_010636 [Fusarium nematophilum]
MAEEGMGSGSRRILAVALEGETAVLSRVVKDLTGTTPSPADSLYLAGTTHPLHLKTPYYSTTVPIWLDLVASPSDWSSSFLSPEAVEVLAVLGGLVVVFTAGRPSAGGAPAKDLVQQVGKVVKQGLGGWEWDGVGLAVGVGGEGNEEEWDEICAEAGLEFVSVGGKADTGRNEFGGFSAKDAPDNDDDADLDPQKMGFGFDKADFEGLRRAIWEASQDVEDPSSGPSKTQTQGGKETEGDGTLGGRPAAGGFDDLDDEEVAKVERMMRKLQAVREAGEGMGKEQRKRMAARAVEEVMREL